MVARRRPMTYLLARVPLFSGLSRADLSRIASVSESTVYKEGHVIVKSGDLGKAFYVIVNGKAKVVKGRSPSSKAEAELGHGDFFGELALLDGEARSRTVVAVTPLETIRIDRPAFRKLLRKEPNLSIALLEGMARRTRQIMDAPSL